MLEVAAGLLQTVTQKICTKAWILYNGISGGNNETSRQGNKKVSKVVAKSSESGIIKSLAVTDQDPRIF